MAVRWLYNSDGDAIAFIYGKHVYTQRGNFVGMVYDDHTIWNGDYVGTIMADDRLFYDTRRLTGNRGIPGTPGLPPFVGDPMLRGPYTCPLGFRDVDFR
jgi:hypothetical protein